MSSSGRSAKRAPRKSTRNPTPPINPQNTMNAAASYPSESSDTTAVATSNQNQNQNPNPNPNPQSATTAAANSNPNPPPQSATTAAANSNPNPPPQITHRVLRNTKPTKPAMKPSEEEQAAIVESLNQAMSAAISKVTGKPPQIPKFMAAAISSSKSKPNPKPSLVAAAAASSSNPDQSSPATKSYNKEDLVRWVDKAMNHTWEKFSVSATPAGSTLPNEPDYYLCSLHDSLKDVVPVDNIYASTPCSLLEKRRFNLPQVNGYLLHTLRTLLPDGLTTVRTIFKGTAYWKNKSGWREVAGPTGETVGICFPLAYTYKPQAAGMWTCDEFISIFNEGTSSVVRLTCRNSEWVELELGVDKAEGDLQRAYQRLTNGRHAKMSEAEINNLLGSVMDCRAILGSKIAELESGRRRLKEEEVRLSQIAGDVGGVEGLVGDDGTAGEVPDGPATDSIERDPVETSGFVNRMFKRNDEPKRKAKGKGGGQE